MTVASVEMISKGQITIPKAIRDKNGYIDGTKFHIVEIGQGYFLSPIADDDAPRAIDAAFDRMSTRLKSQGVSLESMMAELRKIRESHE
ncbi:MAG: AbrB/MazE/SpoVT family DNA-binding domain-containing protein [Capsulimonas sp.]|uniref:AbrB/MazE/SpoVT family DNA-binding domain-containing protein n=1 Tax=Capsulimonas sp. TaxID=2494211 RepID=UPI0032634C94